MSTSEFCFWLNGFFELSGADSLSPVQVQIIKDHLDLVFDKATPDRASRDPEGEWKKLISTLGKNAQGEPLYV